MKRTFLALCAVFAVSTLTACGEDDLASTCGPANCMGCCTAEGRCIPSPDEQACGLNGAICMSCPVGSQCLGGTCKQPSSQCGPQNCSGCCNAAGNCITPISNEACGAMGAPCQNCTLSGQICDSARRTCGSSSSCVPNCTNKCAGGSDGCGGTCQVNDCKEGCCQQGQCVAGKSDYACGSSGAPCENCKAKETTCVAETGSCAGCTPDCSGKCAGAGDDCGGECPTNQCTGCCTKDSNPQCLPGSANDACGASGGTCADCTASSGTCSAGSCSGCTPDCTGKCAGASNGCGGTCTQNQCSGCCTDENSPRCLTGTTNTACGGGGATCTVCPNDFQGYSWICDSGSKTCVKDQPTSIDCSSQPNGTAGCTNNGVTGICWNGACCTGCYDALSGYCVSYTWDFFCGSGGETCSDCSMSNQVCENGECVTPSGPCGGLQDGAPCTDGGLSGTCKSGYCCTGCFDDSSGVTVCYLPDETDADHCGSGGSGCIACDDYESCFNGICLTDTDAQVIMTVSSAGILDTKDDWDSYSGSWAAPDPGVCLWWDNPDCGSNTTPYISSDACTPEEEDTYYTAWLHDLPPRSLADLIAGDICIQLVDADIPPAYDLIGTCLVNVVLSDIQAGYKTLWSCSNPDGNNYVDFIHFSFRPAP